MREMMSRGGLRRLIGIDFHIAMTLALRGWNVLAGAATIVIVGLTLSPSEQGYYFTFMTIVALQVFFELGLNQVMTQLVSHEAAHLVVSPAGAVTGAPHRVERIAAFVAMVRRWYLVAAIAFFLVVGSGGLVFFGEDGDLSATDWLPPWLALVGATALNLRLSPLLAITEGIGHVGNVAKLRLYQGIVGYLGCWVSLLLGGGLWSLALVPLMAATFSGVWLARRHWTKVSEGAGVSWRHDVLPLQWRIALSWLSGYFIFNLFTPVVFQRNGAVEAGRIGMALTVFTAISTVGLSWVNAKVPEFGRLVSKGDSDRLNQTFRQVTIRSVSFVMIVTVVVVAVVVVAADLGLSLVDRVAAPVQLAWLALATVANVLNFACASYMRAHRQEPMVPQAVTCAVAVCAVVFLVKDPTVMLAGYACIVASCLPWTFFLVRPYYTRHAAKASQRPAAHVDEEELN